MKKHISTIGTCFLFAAQLLCSTPGFATDYFVHANVGDNRNSGLQANDAFSTLSYAMSQLSPGDTLYLRSGLYTETVNLATSQYSNGTSTDPITIKSYPNETPVIGSNNVSFVIGGRKWWVFENLTFQNSKPLFFGVRDTNILPVDDQCTSTAENITLRRVRFQHGSVTSIIIACGSHIKIENSVFDNLRARTAGRDTFGVHLTYQANNIIISGNHFSDIGGDGIHILDTGIGSRYVDIEIIDNEFEIVRPYRYRDENGNVIPEGLRPFDNVGENAIDIKQGPGPIIVSNNRIHGFRPTLSGQDATGAIGNGIVIHRLASGITISKNHFYDNVIHVGVGGGIDAYTERDLSVFNNIFEEPADPGIYGNQIPSGLRLNSASNVKIFNNTFYNQPGYEGWVLQLETTDTVELKNNVFQNGVMEVNSNTVTNLMADYNAWSGITGNTWTGEIEPVVLGQNDIMTDDLLVGSSVWEPLEDSPLIDAGTFVGIAEDFYGTVIGSSVPDIGAVEYLSNRSGDRVLLADLRITQAGVPARIVYPDSGPIEVAVDVRDPFPGRQHSFDWSSSDNSLVVVSDYDDPVLRIDPLGMVPGLYRAHVRVTNDNIPAQSIEVETLFKVSLAILRLDANVDSDGDGVADVIEGVGDTDQNGIPDNLDAITDSSVLQGLDGVSDRYLLKTEPGLSLRLGGIALAAGKSSAGLTLEEIAAFGDGMNASVANAEDSFSYSGGIYDFEITGLLRAGQVVKVVLAQQVPVPANAVYRKYVPVLGWQDLVTDASNSIASAPGSDGMCPIPGDAAYRSGLSEGDYCIQLTLEDGGPNDVDDMRNGVIQDPGGVGKVTPQSVNGSDDGGNGGNSNDDVLSSVIGGCTLGSNRSFDPLFLLLIMASIAMIYRRRMHRPGVFKH